LIRNKISFHYEDEDNLTEANFQQLPSTEALHFYFSWNAVKIEPTKSIPDRPKI